jgi:hypothetical protein
VTLAQRPPRSRFVAVVVALTVATLAAVLAGPVLVAQGSTEDQLPVSGGRIVATRLGGVPGTRRFPG